MDKDLTFIMFVNDKGINDLIIVFDKYGISARSHKDKQTAYKNYLRKYRKVFNK